MCTVISCVTFTVITGMFIKSKCFFCFFQAVEELLESLDLEKSSYHMGLSRVRADFCIKMA